MGVSSGDFRESPIGRVVRTAAIVIAFVPHRQSRSAALVATLVAYIANPLFWFRALHPFLAHREYVLASAEHEKQGFCALQPQ